MKNSSNDLGIELQPGEESFAVLVGIYKGSDNLKICEEHLDELESLADTFGVPAVEKIACPLRKIEASTLLPIGKLETIIKSLYDKKANLVIFDEELSAAQQRNLEKCLKVAVMERKELILENLAERAPTKEARLQIELARTKYEFPRLKRLWSHVSRQRASGGYLKGQGEKQMEIDRRLLKRRLKRLSQELKKVKR